MQNEQFNELTKMILALRDSVEMHNAKIDALSKEMVSVKTEVASLREDVTEIKATMATKDDLKAVEVRVTHIDNTMVTKDELKAVETRLMGEIKPLQESVAYLSEQSASHDRKLFLLKNPQKP